MREEVKETIREALSLYRSEIPIDNESQEQIDAEVKVALEALEAVEDEEAKTPQA